MAPPFPDNPDDRPAGEFLAPRQRRINPYDVATAEDPIAAGTQAIYAGSRPLETIGRKDPSQNARTHGLTAKTHNAAEEAEYQQIRLNLVGEYRPESFEEWGAVDQLAEARLTLHKCQRAKLSNAVDLVDRIKAERRAPLVAKVEALESSLRTWDRIQSHDFAFGKGYGELYPILLQDIDPNSNPKRPRTPAAREFAVLHVLAQASPRLLSLHVKYRRQNLGVGQDPEYDEFLEGVERNRRLLQDLNQWAGRHVINLRYQLEKAHRDLANVDSQPIDANLEEMLSDEYRKIDRYRKEAESSIRRLQKTLVELRKRLTVNGESQRRQAQSDYPVMYRVGTLGIHMPRELDWLCPYDQLGAAIQVLTREQRYYESDSRNGNRELAARAKAEEAQRLADLIDPNAEPGRGGPGHGNGDRSTLPRDRWAPPPPNGPDSPR